MGIQFWTCDCGKICSPGMTKCRKCGAARKTFGVVEKKKTAQKQKPPHGKIDYDLVKDPHIGGNDQIFVSTLKMKE